MVLRSLRADDSKSVREIWEDSFLREKFTVKKDFSASWRNRASKESVGLFRQGHLVGFAIVSFHTRNHGNRYVDYIAVHSNYRGCGYGDRLIRHVMSGAKAARRGIHLYPLKQVAPWYKKHGFYWTPGEYMNAHCY
jgi:ribosomal protein S18 acetylase RimI-like enzyme